MTSSAKRTLLSAAIAAVRDCADTMETQATGLKQALPELSLDGESQAAVLELASGLKDTAGRVTFELALLQAELGEGEMPDHGSGPATVQSGLDHDDGA